MPPARGGNSDFSVESIGSPNADVDCSSNGTGESSNEMMDLDEFLVTHAGKTYETQRLFVNERQQPSGDRLTDLLHSIQSRQAVQFSNSELSSSEQFEDGIRARQRRRPRTYKYNPKPVTKKGGRSFVPEVMKDDDYWERRQRNNQAARKSREDRRRKELEVLDKLTNLEKTNADLIRKVDELEKRNRYLEEKMKKYENKIRINNEMT